MVRIKWRRCWDGALVRKRSYELVIHITSIGEFSFLFSFTIFPHLQFTAGEFRILYYSYKFFLVFILTNINLSGSLVLLVSCLFICVHSSICSGTETLQADWKGLVLQLKKGVKSVCTATRWRPHLKSGRANKGFKGSPMPTS